LRENEISYFWNVSAKLWKFHWDGPDVGEIDHIGDVGFGELRGDSSGERGGETVAEIVEEDSGGR
jgi:hypothetical protein